LTIVTKTLFCEKINLLYKLKTQCWFVIIAQMPKGRKTYDTGGQNGLKTCPCGYSFTGIERNRQKAFKLHKQKCEVAKNIKGQLDYQLPKQFYTAITDVEAYVKFVQYGQ